MSFATSLPVAPKKLALALRELHLREERKKQTGPGGLIEFVRYFWDVLEPGREFVDGWAIEAICEHLEAVTFGKINRLLINVPPGFMKSMLVNIFLPAWEWGPMNMGSLRYVAFSYGAHLTERDNGRFRDLVKSRKYQEMWGDRVRLTEDGKVRISNDKTGWKFASSVGGVGTGERGDRVLLDDPHNVKESESEKVRTETVRWFNEAMQNRLNDLHEGAIIVIMQRVHEADVSAEILTKYPGYCHLCIPMEYDPSRAMETDIGWVDPREEPGEMAWPDRFAEEDLDVFRKQKFLWAGQYQQIPAPRSGAIVNRKDWQLWDLDACRFNGVSQDSLKFPRFEYIVAWLDTAYTEKQENNPSAMVIMGIWKDRKGINRSMLIYAWADHFQFNALVKKTEALCDKWKIDRLLVENKANGISVAQELRRLNTNRPWAIQLVDPKGLDKVQRLFAVSHFWENGLIYAPDTIWADMVIDQVSSFPKAAHDDLVDCVSGIVGHFRLTGMLKLPSEHQEEIDERMTHRPGQNTSKPLYPGSA